MTTQLTRTVLALATAALLGAQPGLAQTPGRAAAPLTSADVSATLEATARVVEPAVVEIFTTAYAAGDGVVPSSGDLVSTRRASGSGVIVDPSGFIVTNAHVVRGANRLRVELPPAAPVDPVVAQPHHAGDDRGHRRRDRRRRDQS